MDDSDAAPLVSILVCVYNGETFLPAAIESALAQTFSDFELIVVDDGSKDGSIAIVEQYGDARVRVLRQENQGAAAALETGLCAARGEYIALLDQDDVWEPAKLAVHIDLMQRRPTLDLTFSWFRVIDDAGREIGVHSTRHRGSIGFAELLTDFVIGATSNVVLRRSAIRRAGGFDRGFPRLYDLDLFLRVALLSSGNVEAIASDLMRYRRHDDQISRNLDALRKEWEQTLDKLRRLAPTEVARVEPQARSNMNRYFARIAYENARYRTGLSLLREGFQMTPGRFLTDHRNWLTCAACLSGLLLPRILHRRLERLGGLRKSEFQRAAD